MNRMIAVSLSALGMYCVCPTCIAVAPVAPFTPGNILVTRTSNRSGGTDYLYEYTIAGTLVQTIPVAHPDGTDLRVGDVVYDSQGRVHLVNSDTYISSFDPATQQWTHTPAPVRISNGSDYDLAILGDFIIQRQMRMNINTHEITTINPGSPGTYSETSVGLDGLLYSLGFGIPRWSFQKTNPTTLEKIGPEIQLHDPDGATLDARGITADRNGDVFIATLDGDLYKYDHNGAWLATLVTGTSNLFGIDLRSDGLIMTTSHNGEVIFTDTSFSTLSKFNVEKISTLNSDLYAGFVGLPAPEGSTATLCIAAMILQAFTRHRRHRKSC